MENVQTKLKKKKGFTLIELIIVMAILGILALIAIPKFGQARKDAKANADFATAKTIANTTSALLADEKLTPKNGKITITLPVNDKETGDTNAKAITERLSNSGKTSKPQACDKPFVIKVEENGDVKVEVDSIELYPNQDKNQYPKK